MSTWAHQTLQRMQTVYLELLDYIIVNPNRELIVKEYLIRAEILKRELTKRQTNILFMIFSFSYAFGKEQAFIPKLKDFEMCGVSKTLIKKELDKLVAMNVISWDADNHLFTIRPPTKWDAPYHHGYSDERSKELFILNLKHANIDISSILEKLKKED